MHSLIGPAGGWGRIPQSPSILTIGLDERVSRRSIESSVLVWVEGNGWAPGFVLRGVERSLSRWNRPSLLVLCVVPLSLPNSALLREKLGQGDFQRGVSLGQTRVLKHSEWDFGRIVGLAREKSEFPGQ